MMAGSKWIAPRFSRGEVDRAGGLLVRSGVVDALAVGRALDVINNWRSSHGYPLHAFQMTLGQRSSSLCEHPIVAQRLKRVPSIVGKLQRFPAIRLSRMQDIGGARAVLPRVEDVDRLRGVYRRSRAKHPLVRQKDYVRQPKASGYRGIHLVYRYRSERMPVFNGLQVELQMRTRRQHAWATAVETAGTFLDQSLKSSEGSRDWLRFFELIGSGFALLEGAPVAANVPADADDLIAEIREAALRLGVKETLQLFGRALRVTEQPPAMREREYFLLVLDPAQKQLWIQAYPEDDLAAATRDYLEQEKSFTDADAGAGGQTVLVSSDSLESLRRAFPNYFLDTRMFVEEMDSLLS